MDLDCKGTASLPIPQDGIVGWAAVSPVSSLLAYAGVVEHSVYVAAEARGLA